MKYLIVILDFLLLLSCQKPKEIFLDALPLGNISDPYGPPQINKAYGKDSIRMNGQVYKHGIGTHAPSNLHLKLKGKAKRFKAIVGVDDAVLKYQNPEAIKNESYFPRYVYDGNPEDVNNLNQGTSIIFRLLADNKEIYNSGILEVGDKPKAIDVNISGTNELTLIAESGTDGSFADHANWADAKLITKSEVNELEIFGQPEKVLINHVGYTPKGFKICLIPDPSTKEFTLIDVVSNKEVFRGQAETAAGDWGVYSKGDFSSFNHTGKFLVESGNFKSETFIIHDTLYQYCRETHMNWFLSQRCGGRGMGWHGGCHLDDGIRLDNGKHQDVTGGWHDAGDLRKWGSSIAGLWALSEIALELNSSKLTTPKELAYYKAVQDEVRWGNKYFLAMQEPAGYMMQHIGGDVFKHGDSNHWTDNITGTVDDRRIVTSPSEAATQVKFIVSQCFIGRVFEISDPKYSAVCYTAAKKCYTWAKANNIDKDAFETGAMLKASSVMFGTFGNEQFKTDAEMFLHKLINLQETAANSAKGYFWNTTEKKSITHNLYVGNMPLSGLVSYIEIFPNSNMVTQAKNALVLHVDSFLMPICTRNAFNIVPYAAFTKDAGGGRKYGNIWYRWCYENNEDDNWWNGINPHIASTGAELAKAGRLLNKPEYIKLAQAQLDWILGRNMFNASTVTGLGNNQPDLFRSSQHLPYVPLTKGAVMAGIGSNQNDFPVLNPGWWQTCEYWMPAVAYTLLLEGELMRYSN